ncbi:ABC transporter permease [Sedimentibacter sp. zth1]|uniref:ABC transporter permease n=1 Tax=Sedimentibacter sp. zth1 TaxID=2816908 RepID=UPI001A913B8D|nr:ABC transporter permease [Sedimentibacter sp. zth1]QSX05211.1 ABC transporter permease [Sedimentibacter sp. zth1]
MFFNIFKYNFKCLIKDKTTVFWLLIYPILLFTFFNLAFANLLDGESFNTIDIAVVQEENNAQTTNNFITALDDSNMFSYSITTMDKAEELLDNGKITAIVNCKNDIELIVNQSGMNETITKTFMDTFKQMTQTYKTIIISNPSALENNLFDKANISNSYVKNVQINKNTNVMVIFFYAALAMTCLLSSTIGSDAVTRVQANQSMVAARINIAPTHKLKSFMAMILSAMTFHLIIVFIALFYVIQILGVNFGSNIYLVLLLCVVSSFTGITFGAFISAVIVKKEGLKLIINLVMCIFGGFLSGMMDVNIKYIIQTKAPIVAYINPASLITDGFYALYYYDTLDKYFLNIEILLLLGAVFSFLTYLILRRQKYASI